MSDLFLIAHKVRGEPAFDIALQLERESEDDELIWIIPTSGHRAYPYWHKMLGDLVADMGPAMLDGGWKTVSDVVPPMPADHPDHYTVRAEQVTAVGGLLDRLGLRPKPKTVWRRPL